MKSPIVKIAADASGAVKTVQQGRIVVVVDVIDFSTSMEAVLLAGAREVWGASAAFSKAPVSLSPFRMGWLAGARAKQLGLPVLVVAEPRVGKARERYEKTLPALRGIRAAGGHIAAMIPNLGAEIIKITDFRDKVVLGVSDTGGTAFDAAVTAGGIVCTATIARIGGLTGRQVALRGINRARLLARRYNLGVTMVAASSKSLEDSLEARYLARLYENKDRCRAPAPPTEE